MTDRYDKIIAILGGEFIVIMYSLYNGIIDFTVLSLKTFIIAILGGIGGMFGKWLWTKIIKK